MKHSYCPVDEATRAWMNYRWAWLCQQFGTSGLNKRPLVLATPEFFPDSYQGTAEDVETLVHRVARYMEIDPDTLEVHYYEEKQNLLTEKFQGTAGVYVENDLGKFEIWLEVAQTTDPERIIATIAHELGHVLLLGQKRITYDDLDHEQLTDLITVFMGLGVFNANGMLQEKNVRWGGEFTWSVGRQGYLAMHQFGYAFALYASTKNEDNPDWLKHLRLDVRKACQQSLRYLRMHPYVLGSHLLSVPFPWKNKSEAQLGGEQEPQISDDESQGEFQCYYCNASIDVEPEEQENFDLSAPQVCEDCRVSMEESDKEGVVNPQQEKWQKRFDRIIIWTFATLLTLALLGLLLRR